MVSSSVPETEALDSLKPSGVILTESIVQQSIRDVEVTEVKGPREVDKGEEMGKGRDTTL